MGRPPLHEVGEEPDYRFSFANERTFLAWVRTSLALVAAGVAVIELLPDLGNEVGSYVLGLPLIALGTVLPVHALRRWDRNERAIRLGQPLPPSRARDLLAWWLAATALLAGILFVVESVG